MVTRITIVFLAIVLLQFVLNDSVVNCEPDSELELNLNASEFEKQLEGNSIFRPIRFPKPRPPKPPKPPKPPRPPKPPSKPPKPRPTKRHPKPPQPHPKPSKPTTPKRGKTYPPPNIRKPTNAPKGGVTPDKHEIEIPEIEIPDFPVPPETPTAETPIPDYSEEVALI